MNNDLSIECLPMRLRHTRNLRPTLGMRVRDWVLRVVDKLAAEPYYSNAKPVAIDDAAALDVACVETANLPPITPIEADYESVQQ